MVPTGRRCARWRPRRCSSVTPTCGRRRANADDERFAAMRRVCFFGAYDPSYPRNRLLRDGLRRRGIEVLEACVRETRAFRRYPALLAAWAPVMGRADVVLVPEFRHKDVPLAKALAPR